MSTYSDFSKLNNPEIVHVHAIHPDSKAVFKSLAATPKNIREGKKEFQTACTVCFKFEDVELRKCGRSVWYCSQECQKKHWPTHKKNCSKENGSGIMKLVQNLAGNVVLMTHIQACLILHFDLLRNPHLDKPFMARVDIGIEPADIPQFFDIYMGKPLDIGKPILGMVQVNAIRPATPEAMANLTPMRQRIWNTARGEADSDGDVGSSVGLIEVVKCGSDQAITMPIFISDWAVDIVRKASPWVSKSALTGLETMAPFNADTCLEFINTHIRADKKNKLLLRTEMLPPDIEVIREAGRGGKGTAMELLNEKMTRERIYKPVIGRPMVIRSQR